MRLDHPARFHDGQTAASRAATVTLTAQGLRIDETDDNRFHIWRYEDLTSPEAIPGVDAFRLSHRDTPDAQLVVESPTFPEALARVAPALVSRRGRARRIGKEALLAIGLIAAVVLALFVGIPSLAHIAARTIPASWDDALGEGFENHFLMRGERCDAPAGLAALDKMVARLRPAVDWDRPLDIAVSGNPMVNAFAAPGGRVVLLRGLIEAAETPEEVAGVLAHELGHVVKYHPTENFIRVLGITTLIDLIVGDGSTLLEALGEAGGWLLVLTHSRDAEAEADEVAIVMLAETGVDPNGLASFFARLHAAEDTEAEKTESEKGAKGETDDGGGLDALLAYLSTHPPLADRERRAREAAVRNPRPILNAEEWQALRGICGETARSDAPKK